MESQFGRQRENRFATHKKIIDNNILKNQFNNLKGKITATYFWPGSDVTFPEEEQRSPNYFFKYDKTRSFRDRVNQVLDWMDLPIDKRPAFTTLYFEEPDSIGHKTGPNTANVKKKQF